jgi:hypothetical protein
LGSWRRFLSRQQNFPVGKEFLRQQLRSWLLGKLWAVGEATVSCCVKAIRSSIEKQRAKLQSLAPQEPSWLGYCLQRLVSLFDLFQLIPSHTIPFNNTIQSTSRTHYFSGWYTTLDIKLAVSKQLVFVPARARTHANSRTKWHIATSTQWYKIKIVL